MDYLAVTLARSGSKAVQDKNILTINDIAISHYPIIAANDSKYISTLIYSSDSEEYLKLAQTFFEKNAFRNLSLQLHLRSKKNSLDNASSWDAIKEVVNTLDKKFKQTSITLLAATCPSLVGRDIDKFFENINSGQSAMSAREVDYPLENTFSNNNGFYEKHCISNSLDARQKRKKYYRPDGHIYYRPIAELEHFFPNGTTQLVDLEKLFYINIDSINDRNRARHVMWNV